MVKVKRVLCFFVVILMVLSCASEVSYARRYRYSRGSYYSRKHRYGVPYSTEKRYRYIKSHDLNKDGRVDNRDRLLWTRKYGKEFFPMEIKGTNEDIYEVMDMNEDGEVTKQEFKEFSKKFDGNRDGYIDRFEIEEAHRVAEEEGEY